MKRKSNRSIVQAVRTFAFPVLALLAFAAAPVAAQTPEGTVITNIATVTFTDANTNSYASVSDTVSVTVLFQGGLAVADPAGVSPSAGALAQTIDFVFTNSGNGVDTLQASLTVSNAAVVTNVRYSYLGVDYTTLALLNTFLGTQPIAVGASGTITVVYDVVAATGGLSSDVTLGVTSTRTGGNTASGTAIVTIPIEGTIAVSTPADQDRLPSGGTTYTMVFDVTSSLTGTDDIALTVAASNGNVAIVSIDGVAGPTTTLSFTADQIRSITVVFTVGDVAAGSTSNIELTAVSQAAPQQTESAFAIVTVIRPALAITKGIFANADGTGAVTEVLPDSVYYYVVTVTNSGTAAATAVTVEDILPAELSFVSVTAGAGAAWDSLGEAAGTVTGVINTLAVGATASFTIAVTVN